MPVFDEIVSSCANHNIKNGCIQFNGTPCNHIVATQLRPFAHCELTKKQLVSGVNYPANRHIIPIQK